MEKEWTSFQDSVKGCWKTGAKENKEAAAGLLRRSSNYGRGKKRHGAEWMHWKVGTESLINK